MVLAPRRNEPVSRPRQASRSAPAWLYTWRSWRACSASRSPAAVRTMPWPLRRYNGSPNQSCNMRNWPDTAGCDRCSSSAARLILPASATLAKVSNCSGVMPIS
ncbi:Uncharacterised protein [Bordetella pertussis]|nr:Uncharacterised protein [Bordetella pertussis]CFW07873.1 Uncharacterised protein [Bordetella pertussis]CFW37700.1 Uncharacterised protein [Bordetella pertussis]